MTLAFGWRPSPRVTKILIASACAIISLWALLTFQYNRSSTPADPIVIHGDEENRPNQQPENPKPSNGETDTEPTPPHPKYAFATILTGEGDIETDLKDPYFIAARLLTYQLRHHPQTRSGDVPFLVLVTENIPQDRRDILSRDGAVVVPVEGFSREWIHPKWERWNGVLAKLNLWKLTEYEKIAFLDADSVVFESLDGIFTSPATAVQQTRPPTPAVNMTGPLPDRYMIAGIHDGWVERALPPVPGKEFYARDNYMNAGFFVLSPSEAMFNYYVTLLDQPGLFDPTYPEQNLLNYAHRVDGRMPWQDIGPGWSEKGGLPQDYESGLKSIHQKWWRTSYDKTLDERIANATAEFKDYLETHDGGKVEFGPP